MQLSSSRSALDPAMLRSGGYTQDISRQLYRKVMGHFATGITVITTELAGEVHGMTANAFMAGSLEPPLCVISIRKEARLCDMLLRSHAFGVSFLSEHQRHLSNHFAGRRIDGLVPAFRHVTGVPVLDRALASLTAEVVDTADCGDHILFIGHIAHMEVGEGNPLLFCRGTYGRIDEDRPIERIEPPTFW